MFQKSNLIVCFLPYSIHNARKLIWWHIMCIAVTRVHINEGTHSFRIKFLIFQSIISFSKWRMISSSTIGGGIGGINQND